MAAPMNRRNWLKASTLLTGGLAFAPATWNKLEASPANNNPAGEPFVSDAEILADLPVIKARLSANENPFGPSEKAKIAITGAMAASYQYGFMGNRQLTQKIATVRKRSKVIWYYLVQALRLFLHATAIHFSRQGGNIVTGDPAMLICLIMPPILIQNGSKCH